MSFIRALVLLSFGLGLFVQVAAQAAAVPQELNNSDCAEMARMADHHEVASQSSEEERPCKDMALDCLIAMNCLPPIALSDSASTTETLLLRSAVYSPGISDRLEGRQMRPESPPPQYSLAA